MKNKFTKMILGCAVATILLGAVAGATTIVATQYDYDYSGIHGIRATTYAAPGYVTTWARVSTADGTVSYDSHQGYQTSSADAAVANSTGPLNRTVGYILN